jgi:hypothetical protein
MPAHQLELQEGTLSMDLRPQGALSFDPNRLYDEYIYVQTMTSSKHDLSRNASKTTKAQAYDVRHDSVYVKEQLSFDLAHEMVYAFQDFHVHPHGSGLRSNKRLDDKHFNFFGCGGSGTLMQHISKKCLFDYSHEEAGQGGISRIEGS